MDSMILGIWPLGALLLAVATLSLPISVVLVGPAWNVISSHYKKHQLEKSHAALNLLFKYRNTLTESPGSDEYLSRIEIYEERLNKLKILRSDTVKSLRELNEHIGSLAPYLEEWPLSRVQKKVATWYPHNKNTRKN